ncbi:MAG TPA: mannosyltransferase family protein [Acidimicrobiia bacterium]|nr:mannosyltransferase family protein [Acidimicrobiia bacterium]
MTITAPTRPTTLSAPAAPRVVAPVVRRRWVGPVLRNYGLSRLLVLAAAFVATLAAKDPGAGPWPRIPGPHVALFRVLARWDGAWYIDIAQHGYHHYSIPPGGDAGYAFFPFYSWLTRAVSWMTFSSPLVIAVVLATVFGAIGALLVYVITAELFDDKVALRAATHFCFFPGAFGLSMTYTEALTIAAAAGAIVAMWRHRWVLAGLLGAVAAMTRPTGAVLVLAAAWCAWRAWRRGEGRRPWAAPALTAAGAGVILVYQWVLTGHPLEWLRVETKTWHDHSGFTLQVVQRFLNFIHSGSLNVQQGALNDLVWSTGFLIAGVGAYLMWKRRLPAELMIFGVGALLFAASSFNVGDRPRPLFVAFPVVIAIAASVSGWRWKVVLTLSALAMLAMSLMTFMTLAAVP